jgi:uncharacterized membrane protein YvbJ
MALIKCPDCNKEVSEHAPTCPNCGRPFKELPKSEKVIVEKNQEGCFLQTLNIGCMFIVVIIVIIVVLGIFA